MVNASLETGADIEGSPGLHPRGIPLRSATSLFSANSLLIDLVLNVVAPLLHIGQERREHVTLDDVCPPFGALAVTDGDDVGKIGCDLHAATVLRAAAGLPPDCLRQV